MLGDSIKKFALSQAFSYIEKDPIKNLTHVMDMVDKFAGDGPQSFPRQRQAIRDAINNEDSTAHKLVLRMMTEMDLGFTETAGQPFPQRQHHRLEKAGRVPHQVQLQRALGHPAGPHLCLQPSLQGMLGRRVRQQVEPVL
ncbi:MAG: hypothetical protein ACLS43_07425 [Evtepia gabavorous]